MLKKQKKLDFFLVYDIFINKFLETTHIFSIAVTIFIK